MEAFLKGKITLRQSRVDIITGSAVVILGLFLFFFGIPHDISKGFSDNTYNLSPRTIPYLVSVLLFAFGTIVLFRAVTKARKNDPNEKSVDFYAISFAVIGLCVFFFLSLYPFGYPITNIIMVLGMFYLSGGKKLWHGVTLAVLFTVVSVLFFYVYLKLNVPMGPLEFLFY